MAPPSSSEAHGFGGGGGGAAEPDGSDVALHLDADAEPLLKHTSVPARPPPHLHRAPSKATLAQELSAGGGWAHELSELGKLATPLILSAMSGFMVSMVGLVFVGRLGSQPLSVMILATSFFNVTGLAFLVGSLGAMETLCGQAYGARNYRAVGVALQRAVALTLVLAAGVCALWTQVERILVGLGQDPALAAGAARFLHLSMPSLFFLALGEALKRYLMAQNIVAPAMAAAAAGAAAAPLYFWLLIFRCGLGLDGAALAMNLAQATPMAVLAVWTARREAALAAAAAPERTWHGWSREALRGWGAYSRLAAPSAAVVCLEWWCFEACVLMAGLLPEPEVEVAVMGLMLNISGLLYMIPLGLGSATSVRVGNALGAGLPRAARRAARAAAGATTAIQVLLAGSVMASRHVAAHLFTDDPAVVAAAAPVFPVMAFCLLGDGINATLGGMLRGAARQEVGAVLGIVSYWVVGLPLAGVMALKAGWGVGGLWTGLSAAATINAVAMLCILARTDWDLEARRAAAAGDEFATPHDLEVEVEEGLEFAWRSPAAS